MEKVCGGGTILSTFIAIITFKPEVYAYQFYS
jgi:hypothetical protein